MNILKQNILSNFIWRFAERLGAQIVQFFVSIVLARLIAPEEFGILAIVIVLADIFQVFVDSGLGNALIQKKDADDLDFSSVFIFNVICCLFLYGIVYAISPLLAEFYGNRTLIPVIRVLCITIVISGLKNVQQAYVSRTMQFKKFFFATLAGTVMSAVVGISMALCNLGVWALVAQRLVNTAMDTLILWFTVEWHPKMCFSLKRLISLASFGWKLLASSLLDTIYNNLRKLIIGKKYTESDLAYYNQGEQVPQLIITNIIRSIDSVLLPVMSKEQDNKARIQGMTRRSIQISTYIVAPAMIGLIVIAPTLVSVVLTDKWLPCVFYLRLFCLDYMFWPIHTSNLNAIMALGRSDVFFKLEIIKKGIGVIVLILSLGHGIRALAIGVLITGGLSQVVNSIPNKKLLGYGYLCQIKDILPNICMALIMGGIVHAISFFGLKGLSLLIVQMMSGFLIYVLVSILFKNKSFSYLSSVAKALINKKKTKERNKK